MLSGVFAKLFGRESSKPPTAAAGDSAAGDDVGVTAVVSAAAAHTSGKATGGAHRSGHHGLAVDRTARDGQLDPIKDSAEISRRLRAGGHSITTVSIPQYRVKGSYVEYVVECTQGNACWRVFRRYQQFKALEQSLSSLCARGTPNHGDYGVLPVLPGSHWMEVTNQSPELVDRRRRFLEIYLQQLLVPRNLFYVARTPLYAFLHDGEVSVDVRAVSVRPLLGLATLSLADTTVVNSSGNPISSLMKQPLVAAAIAGVASVATHTEAASDEVVREPSADVGSPLKMTTVGEAEGWAATEIAAVGISAVAGPAMTTATCEGNERSGADQSSCASKVHLPFRCSPSSPAASPASASTSSSFSTSPTAVPTSALARPPPFQLDSVRSSPAAAAAAGIFSWVGDDVPSGDESVDSNAAIAGARLPPQAPNCLGCNAEFNSTLYPHRCHFCRARFCQRCMWHLHLAPEDGGLTGDATSSVSPLSASSTVTKAAAPTRSRWDGRKPSAKGTARPPSVVNACRQCTENYRRRWDRQRVCEAGSTGTNATIAAATTAAASMQVRQPQEISPSASAACQHGGPGLTNSSSGSAAATTTATACGHMTDDKVSTDPSSRQTPLPMTPFAGGVATAAAAHQFTGKLSVLPAPTTMRVGLEDFQLLTCLGRGTFGKVMKVRLRATNVVYAMKVMNKAVIYKRYMTSYIKEEKSILTLLPPHPYVVRCHFAFQSDYYLFFIIDYLPGGELYDLMYPTLRLTPVEARFYIAELILAVDHLHRYDVVHRDIKPENIVLGRDGHLKLTDFGLARKNFSHTRRRSFVGSAEYVAPETIQGECQTPALDWWSVGVLLYEMLAGRAPFHADNNSAVYESVLQKEVDFFTDTATTTSPFTPEAVSLIKGLLTRDVTQRLQDAETICAHPYFTGLDWHALRQKELPAPRVPYLAENDVRHFKRDFTSEWASVPPPPILATRASMERLTRCFDNFPLVGEGLTSADTGVAASSAVVAPPPLSLDEHHVDPLSDDTTAPAVMEAGLPSLQAPVRRLSAGSYARNNYSSYDHQHHLRIISGSDSGGSNNHGIGPHDSQRLRQQASLLGVWRLLKLETCALDGRIIYPWGGDVVGLLLYLPTGEYAMQLAPLRRRRLRHAQITQATREELGDVYCSYAAQFGTFSVPAAMSPGPGSEASLNLESERVSANFDNGGAQETDDGGEEDLTSFNRCLRVLHRVEANLCPNLAQRLTTMRFRIEEPDSELGDGPLESMSNPRSAELDTAAAAAGGGGGGSRDHTDSPSPAGAAGSAAKTLLRLATEPELVADEPFRARTVMTWLRVKAFAKPSTPSRLPTQLVSPSASSVAEKRRADSVDSVGAAAAATAAASS